MEAYLLLYPYAVVTLAIVAAVMTVISGGISFIFIVRTATESVRKEIAQQTGNNYADPWVTVPYVAGATVLFVGACLAAMLILKLGAWVVA